MSAGKKKPGKFRSFHPNGPVGRSKGAQRRNTKIARRLPIPISRVGNYSERKMDYYGKIAWDVKSSVKRQFLSNFNHQFNEENNV